MRSWEVLARYAALRCHTSSSAHDSRIRQALSHPSTRWREVEAAEQAWVRRRRIYVAHRMRGGEGNRQSREGACNFAYRALRESGLNNRSWCPLGPGSSFGLLACTSERVVMQMPRGARRMKENQTYLVSCRITLGDRGESIASCSAIRSLRYLSVSTLFGRHSPFPP